jgi:hypothetical protein
VQIGWCKPSPDPRYDPSCLYHRFGGGTVTNNGELVIPNYQLPDTSFSSNPSEAMMLAWIPADGTPAALELRLNRNGNQLVDGGA